MIAAKVAKIKSVYFDTQISAEKIIRQAILDGDMFTHIPKMYCNADELRTDWYEVYESPMWSEFYLVSWDI